MTIRVFRSDEDGQEPPLRCYIRPILDDARKMPHDMPHCCILQRQIKPTVDFDLLAGWLKTCDQDHNHHMTVRDVVQNQPPLKGLRFIDVANRCIVESPQDVKYAALSYTWGSRERFCLTRENADLVKNVGSLRDGHGNVHLDATTIDAFKVCERLDIPFLWIDRLCIVQNDLDNKQGKADQIRHMDQVYANAYITLVAASERYDGTDSSCSTDGLSRVSVAVAPSLPTITVDGVSYAILLEQGKRSLEQGLASSVWYTRGWYVKAIP